MIIEGFVICTEAASKNNVEYDLLKSINDVIFKDIVEWTRHPTSLRCELSKFGVWYFKKQKTMKRREAFDRTLDRVLERNIPKEGEIILLSRIENLNFILREYEKYNRDKYEIKCLKYGKENYDAYCLAKRQEKIQKAEKDKPL